MAFSGLTIASIEKNDIVKVKAATEERELGDGTVYRQRLTNDLDAIVEYDSKTGKVTYNSSARSFLWYEQEGEKGNYVVHYSVFDQLGGVKFKANGVAWEGYLAHMNYYGMDGSCYERYDENVIFGLRPVKSEYVDTESEITLPSTVTVSPSGKAITAKCVELADYAFAGTKITNVRIPDTYQRICDGAFADCSSLTSVEFISDIDGKIENTDGSSLHALGSYAFAGCRMLEYPIILDNLFRLGEVSEEKQYYKNNTKYYTSPYSNVRGEDTGDGCYYMGVGVFQDCYHIKEVELGNENLTEIYVPQNTFAGCSELAKLNINEKVEKIIIGQSAFSGSEGGRGNDLQELYFNCDVVMDSYAFSNCHNLKDVTFCKGFNKPENMGFETTEKSDSYFGNADYNLYNRYSVLNFVGIFQNSFTKQDGAKLTIYVDSDKGKSDNGSELILPNAFLKGAKKLSQINLNTVNEADGTSNTDVKIDRFAFEDVPADLNITGKNVYLYCSAFSGYNGKNINVTSTDKAGSINTYGEIFAETKEKHAVCNQPISNLQKISFDAPMIKYGTDKVASGIVDSYTKENCVASAQVESSATFYGVGEQAKLYYGDRVEEITGFSTGNVTVKSVFAPGGSASNSSLMDATHNSLGQIQSVYITNPKTKISKNVLNLDNTSEYTLYGYTGVETTDSKENKTYAELANQDNDKVKFCTYISNISIQQTKPFIATETFENYNHKCITVHVTYGDGTDTELDKLGAIPYGGTDSLKGYVLSKASFGEYKNITEDEKIGIDIQYRGVTYSSTNNNQLFKAQISPLRIVSFDAEPKADKIFVEGETVSASDFDIDNITYNNESSGNPLTGKEKIEVSLDNDTNVLENGVNYVKITVDGVEKIVKVSTVQTTEQSSVVVSLSAISVTEFGEGHILCNDDFKVTAYYSNGDVVEDFQDFEVLTKDQLTLDTKIAIIALKGNDKIARAVDIEVKKYTPMDISVKYTGNGVIEGQEINKENLIVTLTYSNSDNVTVLRDDEYTLLYTPIVADKENMVKVVLNRDTNISKIFYVTGIKATENDKLKSPAPVTQIPVSTLAPSVSPGTTNEPSATAATGNSDTPIKETPVATTAAPSKTNGTQTVDNSKGVSSSEQVPNEQPKVGTTKTSKITLGVNENVTVKSDTISSCKTDDDTIATVLSNGTIIAKKVGKTTITVIDKNNNTMKIIVTVKKAPKKVSANFKNKKMKVGKKVTLKAKFAAGYYSNKITFTSSNKKVATVTSKGIIKAKKKGTCKITMKTYNGKKVTVKITVK